MHRFYLETIKLDGNQVVIDSDQIIRQITKVLRLKIGDNIEVFQAGSNYRLRIAKVLKTKIYCDLIGGQRKGIKEVDRSITLYQSLLKSDKFEWVLQKCTELGTAAFVPVLSKNCVQRELSKNKQARYEEIIREATEQCGGTYLAGLEPVLTFEKAIKSVSLEPDVLNIIAWENESYENGLGHFLELSQKKINIFIGPEGGYDQSEIELAKKNDFLTISLGKRILRAETAAITAVAKIIF